VFLSQKVKTSESKRKDNGKARIKRNKMGVKDSFKEYNNSYNKNQEQGL
jgi:hypothetical protein